MKYFLLNAECYFIKGALKSTIYNCHTGQILSLDPQLTQVIDKCEKGISLNKIPEYYNYKSLVAENLQKLCDLDIGMFYDTFYKIDKLKPILRKKILRRKFSQPLLKKIFIVLNNKCNLACHFCLKSTYKTNRKTGCKLWPDMKFNKNHKPLSIDSWKRIISYVRRINCYNLTFLGGEPLLNKNLLLSLIEYAKKLNYNSLEVYSNGILLKEDISDFFKQFNVIPIIQVHSRDSKISNRITRSSTYHKALVRTLNLLKNKETNFKLKLVVDKYNANEVIENIEYYKSFNPSNITIEHIYNNDNYNSLCIDNNTKITKTNISKDLFFLNCEYNTCWNGRLSFTEYGNVNPCPMARKQIIGNIQEKDFKEIIRDEDMNDYWDLSRDKIEICSDCEYRYFCIDCRPLEMSMSENRSILCKTKFCFYNPYTGIWSSTQQKEVC